MSTPEDRLKKLADQLESEHGIRQKKEQQETAKQRDDLRQRAQVAQNEAQAWLNRAEEMVAATRKRVPVFLKTDIPEGPGFELRVGMARVQAMLRSDGWHIVRTSPDDLHPKSGLPVADFARLREMLLERMVEQGLRDLYAGRVSPGPDDYPRR